MSYVRNDVRPKRKTALAGWREELARKQQEVANLMESIRKTELYEMREMDDFDMQD